jgi:hypothetical protein
MVVSEVGVYSVGRMREMRWRQSSPPIEWAIKLTDCPGTRSARTRCISVARSSMEPVLERRRPNESRADRADAPWDTCNHDICAYTPAQDIQHLGPIVQLQLGKNRGATYVESVQTWSALAVAHSPLIPLTMTQHNLVPRRAHGVKQHRTTHKFIYGRVELWTAFGATRLGALTGVVGRLSRERGKREPLGPLHVPANRLHRSRLQSAPRRIVAPSESRPEPSLVLSRRIDGRQQAAVELDEGWRSARRAVHWSAVGAHS